MPLDDRIGPDAAPADFPVRGGGLLFLGASNPIRDLDLMATAHPVGERRMDVNAAGTRLIVVGNFKNAGAVWCDEPEDDVQSDHAGRSPSV